MPSPKPHSCSISLRYLICTEEALSGSKSNTCKRIRIVKMISDDESYLGINSIPGIYLFLSILYTGYMITTIIYSIAILYTNIL